MQSDNANFKSEFNKRLINFSLEIIKLWKEAQELLLIFSKIIRSSRSKIIEN